MILKSDGVVLGCGAGTLMICPISIQSGLMVSLAAMRVSSSRLYFEAI